MITGERQRVAQKALAVQQYTTATKKGNLRLHQTEKIEYWQVWLALIRRHHILPQARVCDSWPAVTVFVMEELQSGAAYPCTRTIIFIKVQLLA